MILIFWGVRVFEYISQSVHIVRIDQASLPEHVWLVDTTAKTKSSVLAIGGLKLNK